MDMPLGGAACAVPLAVSAVSVSGGGEAVPVWSALRPGQVCARLLALGWTQDLAEEIGTPRWYRSLACLFALSASALAFMPDLTARPAVSTTELSGAARDEFRSLTILPLAQGGESGRHMGATALSVPLATAPERASLSLSVTLARGDNFAAMLARNGVSAADAGRAAALIGSAVPTAQIAPGTRVELTLGHRLGAGQERSLDKLALRARYDLDLGIRRQAGGLLLVRQPLAVDATPLRIRGTVGTGLYLSARAAGAPIQAVQQYLATLDSHLSLDSDIQPSDQFDIIVSYKRSAGGMAEVGDLLFAGLERNGKPLSQLLRWGSGTQFYDVSNFSQPRAALYMPVAGHVTSNFGMRFHPILGYSRLHAGIDIGAPYGSPIHAISDGVVAFAGVHGGHGNYVKLAHGGGMDSGYGHMSRIAVSPGPRVRAGQVIGYVGSTGLSTGPHLHYEIFRNGAPVNPLGVHFAVHAEVDVKQLAAFKARIAQLKAIKPGAALQSLGGAKLAGL